MRKFSKPECVSEYQHQGRKHIVAEESPQRSQGPQHVSMNN